MAIRTNIRYFLCLIGAAFVIISIFLTAVHSKEHCNYTINGKEKETCRGYIQISCAEPASEVHINISPSNPQIDLKLVCPWEKTTLALSYTSSVLGSILLLLFAAKLKTRLLNMFIALILFSGLVIACFISTISLMILNLEEGEDSITKYEYIAGTKELIQRDHIINVAMIGLGLVVIVYLFVREIRTYRNRKIEQRIELLGSGDSYNESIVS